MNANLTLLATAVSDLRWANLPANWVLVMIIIFANFPDTGMNGDFTTPAVERIPHAGESAPH